MKELAFTLSIILCIYFIIKYKKEELIKEFYFFKCNQFLLEIQKLEKHITYMQENLIRKERENVSNDNGTKSKVI